jgi:hypothetical protein
MAYAARPLRLVSPSMGIYFYSLRLPRRALPQHANPKPKGRSLYRLTASGKAKTESGARVTVPIHWHGRTHKSEALRAPEMHGGDSAYPKHSMFARRTCCLEDTQVLSQLLRQVLLPKKSGGQTQASRNCSCRSLPGERCPEADVARELPQVRLAVKRVQYHGSFSVGNLLLWVVPFLNRLVELRSAVNLA